MTEMERAQERLDAAIAKHLKQRTARSQLRAELAERRLYGLQMRHAAKLARNRPPSTDSSTGPNDKP